MAAARTTGYKWRHEQRKVKKRTTNLFVGAAATNRLELVEGDMV